jgi:hypothetical protein
MNVEIETLGLQNYLAIAVIVFQLALFAVVLLSIHKDESMSQREKWLWTALVFLVPYAFVVWFAIKFWRKREANRQR